jgi:hypothetical protein
MHRYCCSFLLICLISLPLNSGWAANQLNADAALQTTFRRALSSVEAAPGGFMATNH